MLASPEMSGLCYAVQFYAMPLLCHDMYPSRLMSSHFLKLLHTVHTGLCCAIHANSNRYSTMLRPTIRFYTILYCTILYCTIRSCTILYCTRLGYVMLYGTILSHPILFYPRLYCTVLYNTIQYETILYYTILYYPRRARTTYQNQAWWNIFDFFIVPVSALETVLDLWARHLGRRSRSELESFDICLLEGAGDLVSWL